MRIIKDKLIAEIAEHLPEESHSLFLDQVNVIQRIIGENEEKYKQDLGFRTAMDIIIKEILMGSFLGLEEEPT